MKTYPCNRGLNFSSPLSEENAIGVRFQSHTEYKRKTAKLDSFVLSEWRSSNHIENMLHILSLGSVTHCFKLLQPREQPQIGERGSNPGSGSQSVFDIFFSIGSTCYCFLFYIC